MKNLSRLGFIVFITILFAISFKEVNGFLCFSCHGTSVSAVTSSCWGEVNDEHARFVALDECSTNCSITTLNHTRIGLVDYTRTCESGCTPGCYDTPFGTTLCKHCCNTDKCNALIPKFLAKVYEKDDTASLKNLRTWLTDHFSKPRHHAANPSHKFHTRHELTKLLVSFGCEFEKQNFTVSEIHEEETAPKNFASFIRTTTDGYNLICKYPGINYGTSSDKIVVVMAHFDSDDSGSPAVNDNGSGSVALLEIARLVGHYNCTRDYTVVFVMTDYEEHGIFKSNEDSDEECQDGDNFVHKVGSRYFVCNWLLPYLNQQNIELVTTINLHSLLNTHHVKQRKPFKKYIQKILKKNRRGKTFLKSIQKHKSGDWLMMKHYNVNSRKMAALNHFANMDESLKFVPFEISLTPTPDFLFTSEFIHTDDCASFIGKSKLSCITLSDTGRHRGYMQNCFHADCDDLTHATEGNLKNLATISDILYDTVEAMAHSMCINISWMDDIGEDIPIKVNNTINEEPKICDTPLMHELDTPSESTVQVSAQCAFKHYKRVMCESNREVWAVLNSDTAWIPQHSEDYSSFWYEVDFRTVVNITAIEMKGVSRIGYIKSFLMAYGVERELEDWQWYQTSITDNASSIVPGNNNYRKVKRIEFYIQARFVRLYPYDWKRRVALQIQFYGC